MFRPKSSVNSCNSARAYSTSRAWPFCQLLAGRSRERTWHRPAVARRPNGGPLVPASVSLELLATAFSRALKFAPVTPPVTIIKPHLSLETITRRLHDQLPSGFALHTIIEGCRDRLEIVVTFLALLELVRSGAAVVTQAGQFEPIQVEAAHA
jgi:hypothetical protein